MSENATMQKQAAPKNTSGKSVWIEQPVPQQMSRTYFYQNGTTVTKKGGTVAWRNNNEGNLRPGALSSTRIGVDQKNFAVFATPEEGRAAKKFLLFSSGSYKDLTLKKAIARYAPASDNNNPASYANFVMSKGNVTDKVMCKYSADEQERILNAMKRQEGYKEGEIITGTASSAAVQQVAAQATSQKQSSASSSEKASDIDVQAAIKFNKRVNAGRVEAIQTLVGTKADGIIGPNTVNKIAEWQKGTKKLTADGKFGSASLSYAIKNCNFKDPLASDGNANTNTNTKPADKPSSSGGTSHTLGSNSPTWCTNNGYINSKNLEDLKGGFKTVAMDVIGGLRAAGASITVTATFRHPMRAATMYYARYYNENKAKANKAQEVFKQYGISMSASSAGAKAALSAFGVANGGKAPVGLYSNHREGHAVDMKIANLPSSFKVGNVTIKTGGNKGGVTANASALSTAIKNSSSDIKNSFKWYGANDNVHWSLTGR